MTYSLKSGWVFKPLIEVATLQRGYDLPVQNRSLGNVPIFAANGPVGTQNEAKVSGPGVITGRSGSIGKVHYVDSDYWPLNTALYVKDFHGNDPKFIYYLLSTFGLEKYSEGTGVPTLNRNNVHGVNVPLPPLPEQKLIAAILDKADSIRRKRQEAVRLTEELASSAFLEMFGDPASNSKGWRVDSLDTHINFLTTGSRGWAEYYSSEGSRFIRSLDVQMNYISKNEMAYVNAPNGAEAVRTRVQPGDVLLTVTGSKIGRVAPVPKEIGDAYVSQHVAIIRTAKTLHPAFLSMFLSLPCGGQRLIHQSQYGQTKPGLNLDQIREFKVPCPPIASQNQFADFCERAIGINLRFVNVERTSDALFNSLMQRAFNGEL